VPTTENAARAPHAPERIVIVGAGAAGLGAAEAARSLGHEGSILLVGDEPHEPYDRPPLSKQFLSGAWEADRLPLRDRATLHGLGIGATLADKHRTHGVELRCGVEVRDIVGEDGRVSAVEPDSHTARMLPLIASQETQPIAR